MAQDKVTLQFTDTAFWNAGAENGTGAYSARFVVVHPGREAEAESIRNAFKSANGRGTRIRDGVMALTEKQIDQRIEELKQVPGQESTIAEMNRGREHVQHLKAAHPNGPTAPVSKVAFAAQIAS